MSENKIYKKLPGVLQTTAIKNFFESTVDQLFSKANSEIINGFIGERNPENHKSGAAFLQEETATRQFYSLSPVVNTINVASGESENLIFFDELLDTLKTYGVDTKNQNKIFGENYYSYLPPVDVDKILNYQEYFWSPEGPPSIQIQGTLAEPIDVEKDIIGKTSHTIHSGMPLKNGMIVRFVGDFVIPRAYLNTDYIIEGVGTKIRLVEKDDSFESFASTSYTALPDPADQYDSSLYSLSDLNVVFSAANITSVSVVNGGIGYVSPTVAFIGANDSPAAATVTLDANGSVSSFVIVDGGVEYSGPVGVVLQDIAVSATVDVTGFVSYGSNPVISKEFVLNTNTNIKAGQVVTGFVSGIVEAIDTTFDSNANTWVHTLTLEDAQTFSYAEANASPTLSFTGRDFLGEVRRDLMHTVSIAEFTGSITGNVLTVTSVSSGSISTGMSVTGTGLSTDTRITSGSGLTWYLNNSQEVSTTNMTGRLTSILSTQAVTGIDPNTGEYYFRGGKYSFDKDYLLADGTEGSDDIGDLVWGGRKNEIAPDYILIARGARNKNVWSRTNFWFHKDNFIDAGVEVPENTWRAKRPIIEFDHNIELYNHGTQHIGTATIAATEYKRDQQYSDGGNVEVGGGVIGMMSGSTIDDVPVENSVLIFPNEELNIAKYVYLAYTDIDSSSPTFGRIKVRRLGHPTLNPPTLLDGDAGFIPWEVEVGDVIQITSGRFNIGNEYYWSDDGWKLAQQKNSSNQAPLFNLYDDQANYLGDEGIYPASSFAGNEIFSYKVSSTVNAADDSILGFPLSYRAFKASSEIEFENDIINETVSYTPIGTTTAQTVAGYYFYKNTDTGLFETHWKPSAEKSKQRIITNYNIDQYDIDQTQTLYYIGAIPNAKATENSGYDIKVTVNGVKREDFTYLDDPLKIGFIAFDEFNFNLNDFIEISVGSDTGLISLDRISKYELPISWRQDPSNVVDVISISEPEFLPHFKNFMESQDGFLGNPLESNNFSNTSKNSKHAKDIVYTDQNLVLGSFLLDDQPHNLIDALRFNAAEYEKYKNRLKKEINNYFNTFSVENFSNEYVLERILRNLISYRAGINVFNRTYVVPFGDNYSEETFVINDVTRSEFVSSIDADLDKIENSLLVYKNANNVVTLLTVDKDYSITSYSPITVQTTSDVSFLLGEQLIFKIYNDKRDSAQCPPTPSTAGLYPLSRPEIMYDNTYETPIQVVLGHDGSRTPVLGDRRDEILLEFEKRIYNAAKAEFRSANSLPELNFSAVKKGAFRDTGFANREWFDLLRFSFANWVSQYNLDFVKNEYFDENDEFSWNYRGNVDVPGHWRGWMEYYYDTYEPHRHPWEMLGFFEKPTWWEDQYGTDYSSMNMALWDDLGEGIIRQGPRENVTGDKYLTNNPFRREGLHMVIPVDENGNLKSPFSIITTGTTLKTQEWTNSRSASAIASLGSSAYKANSFLTVNGLNVSYDASNIYVEGRAIINHIITNNPNAVGHSEVMEQDISFVYPRTASGVATNMPEKAVAVLVNGLPLHNPTDTATWNDEGVWHYNKGKSESHSDLTYGHASASGVLHYYYVDPVVLGLEEWSNTSHSPIVGWAFDGLPIYGPYGYRDPLDPTSEITNIKSPFRLRQGTRVGSLAGAHSGMFVEDYDLDAALIGAQGYTDIYNTRYGYTPDSPTTPIRYYVATIDDNGDPMFPYAVGGGVKNHTGSGIVWGAKYFAAPLDIANNTAYTGTVGNSTTGVVVSVSTETQEVTGDTSAQWKFGDMAPVEYAWKSSPVYPFAVAEALLLAKPGLFAAEFSDPTNILRPAANPSLLLNKSSRKRWDFANENNFRIHGTYDNDDNFITNIGYTQFINSWINFQGLDQTDDFAKKLRSLNIKLGHRMAGFIDEDTTVVRTDQYSTTGKATSLIVPKENITVQVHNSPYKTRNFYSGVIIEKTLNGYKVRGFDKNYGYFDTFETDKTKGREKIQVGGKPADFVDWNPGVPYKKDTIVQWQNGFYKAPKFISATTSFDARLWKRIPSLPQVGGASATLYQTPTENIVRVDYETEFTSASELYDFLIGLGYYQQAQGYDLNDFDESINEVRNWSYAAKQFLFWTTGRWEVGNTLELSPLARRIAFEAPRGFISKINRTDREQFTILDQDGIAISPSECEILREDNRIEVTPPEGKQIYGLVLFTKEIEHAITIDNTTIFNDVIFDTNFNQRHTRLKIKATRTKGWSGRLLTDGFIVNGSELLPNLDNMAQSLGRYHELGFIPVEKEIYKAARSMFGFEERDYLKDLDISEDDQFEFYRGMIQNKGTSASLRKIAASNVVVQGNVTVYDEWALKVADFGDTDNNQSVELKLEKSEIVNDPQLITLAFPEDITGIVEKIDVISRRYKYYNAPEIVISAPTTGTNRSQATATATLNAAGELDSITVTNQGQGYAIPVGVTIIAGNVVTGTVDTTFQRVTAISTGDWIATSNASLAGNIVITDHFGNSNVTVNLSSVTDAEGIVTAINNTPGLGGNITGAVFRSDVEEIFNANALTANVSYQIVSVGSTNFTLIGAANNNVGTAFVASGPGTGTGTAKAVVAKYTLTITGNDFSIVSADANLHLTNGRYQPAQRYSVSGANTTVAGNITVTVDGAEVNQFVNGANSSGGYNWTFDEGDRWGYELQGQLGPAGTFTYTLGTGTEHSSSSIASENNYVVDGEYKHLKLYINGFHTGYTDVEVPNQLLLENSAVAGSTEYQNVWEVNGGGNQVTLYIDRLPKSVKYFSATSNNGWVLPAINPNRVTDPKTIIKLVESPTVQFTNNYQGDLPDSVLNIVVKVQDGIAIKLGARKSYEITPELRGDDIILFDIDDPDRFLKKPSGVREYNLWPTTRNANFTGIWDNSFLRMPNAGYVNSANVNFMAYSIADLPDLFSDNIIVKPSGGHLIHVAVSENSDWNVYKLEPISSTVSFLYQTPGTSSAKLVTNTSLFNYLDSNMIGEPDTIRYLDYFLTLKNADVSDNVVVWTNERIIQQRQADITNPKAPRMIEARIKSIGPAPGSNIAIADYKPVTTKIYPEVQVSNSTAANTLVLNFRNVHNIKENDAITLTATSGVQYYSNATVVLNSAGNVTFTSASALPSEFAAPAYVKLYTEDKNIYNKSVYVESVNVAASTFTVKNEYFANSNVLVGLGNIDYLLTVTPNYDAGNADIYYLAANVTSRKLEITGPELANIVSGVQYNAAASNVTFNGNGNISIKTYDFIPLDFKVPGNITLYADNDPVANGNVYYVESIDRRGGFVVEGDMASPTATTLVVKDPYFSNANIVYNANANVTFNSYGNVTINSAGAIPANFAVPGYIKLRIGSGGVASSNNRPVYVTAANLVTNTFTVVNDGLFTTANATANLNVVGYSLELPSNTVSELGNVTFTLTVPSTVEVRHMDRTKIITSDAHNANVGQVVRIFSNAFTGTYTVRSTPDDRSIEIDAPFTYNDDRTGWLIKKGLQIKTTDPHGISPEYAKNRKRIAIHFADPRLYNDIYFIDEITPDSIIVKDRMPLEGVESVYVDRVQAYAKGANLATRTVQISNNGLLAETTVLYTANSQLVPHNAYIVNPTNIVFNANILDSNTSVATGFTIFREMDVEEDRYPILTTLDHGVVKLNGIDLSITSYNNLEGTVDAINREMNLRRAAISSQGNTMSVGFNMLSDINTELPVPAGTKNYIASRQFSNSTAGNLPINSTTNGAQLGSNNTVSAFAPAYQIGNYGPYVKDENTLISLSSRDAITGNLILSSGRETNVDPDFNKGPIKVGPLRGISYTDLSTGQVYLWNFEIGKYVRVQPARAYTADPDDDFSIGLDTLRSEITYNPDPAFADGTDSGSDVVFDNDQGLVADSDEEDQNPTESIPVAPPYHSSTAPILTALAGNGPVSYIDPAAMGKKRPLYDLTATRGGNVATSPYGADTGFSTFAGPRWSLKAVQTQAGWLIEVYEIVKNDQDKYYWILVDKVWPPSYPHDFWGTINANNSLDRDSLPLPVETLYYYTDTEFTGNTSTQIDSVSANEAYYIDIPPVEPAFYVGKQLIPEPFAVAGGNNSNAAITWAKLPPSVIGASAPNLKDTKITVNGTGYNSFLMWAPGLTPGKWDPQVEGPGHLDGFAGYPTFWGYGSGYYNATGGGQSPASYISGGTDPYPGAANEGWSTRQPRFKYSKNFTVFPLKNNDVNELANTVILDGQTNHDNPANTLVRADDIFVACFWTEAHTYKNQLVGYNYKNFDAEGNPAPIYKDYNGTVTRVKYIRLSELPPNAVLRRPIPDTGWGGKGWKNLVTDTVKLPGEYNPVPGDANNPWSAFQLTSLPSGSTGESTTDPNPSPVGDPQPIAETGNLSTPLNGGRGLGRANNDLTYAAPLVNGKPVLTGGALEALPGPCQLSPVVVPPTTNLPCYNRPSEVYGTLITELDANALTKTGIVASANIDSNTVTISKNLVIDSVKYASNSAVVPSTAYTYIPVNGLLTFSNSVLSANGNVNTNFTVSGSVHEEHTVIIVGNNPFYVFFDFSSPDIVANGVTIEQSDDNSFGKSNVSTADIKLVTTTMQTPITDGGIARVNDGQQIGVYGITNIPRYGTNLLQEVNSAFGTDTPTVIGETKRLKLERLEAIDRYGEYNGVKNIGFLSKTIDCRNGQYVRVTVNKGAGNTTGKYKLYLIYTGPSEDPMDPYNGFLATCADRSAPSRVYRAGARIKQYTYADAKRKKRVSTTTGAAIGAVGGIAAATIGGAGVAAAGAAAASAAVSVGASAGVASAAGAIGAALPIVGIGLAVGALLSGLFGSKKKGLGDGYFGGKNAGDDNVYYPYGTGSDSNTHKTLNGVNANGRLSGKTVGTPLVDIPSVPNYTTYEFKGYYRAPVDGTYTFSTTSDDGSWVWVSPNDDLSDDEYYKDNGYQPGNPKNYNKENALVKNGGLHGAVTQSGSIQLKGGKYYFIRGIFGNNKGPGSFIFRVKPPNTPEEPVKFSGRTCPGDEGYVSQAALAAQDSALYNPAPGTTPDNNTPGYSGPEGCPDPLTPIMVSPFETRPAGELVKGDIIYTMHEKTGEYGYFTVESAEEVIQDKLLFKFENDSEIIVSDSHRFLIDGSYVKASLLRKGDNLQTYNLGVSTIKEITQVGSGPVIKFEINDAHTYIANGFISHNVKYWPGFGGGFNDFNFNTYSNFSGYSQPEMTGHAYMPTSYKIRNTKKVVDPQSYGYSVALDSNRFVNATSQRVTGGFVIPLAKKLEVVSRTPRPLKSTELSSQPWFKTSQLNLDQTFRAVNYSPKRIGSTFMLDTMASPISNVVNGMVVTNNNGTGGITLSPTGPTIPGIGVSAQQAATENSGGIAAATNNVIIDTPVQEAPFENRQDKIKYTAIPTINITPLVFDANGGLVPAGAPAIAKMVKPTPTASVSAQNLASIPQGSELVINGRTILAGTTAETFKAQINCADIGIRADINKATGNLVLRSCTDNPFNVQNGCGPGKLKQVADFHISRGFEQSKSVTAGTNYTDRALNVYAGNADVEWTQYNSDDELEAVLPLANSIIGARTNSASTTTNFSTGGSGYSVGDRLRLIGGTPVNNSQGPLTVMCIDDPGYGYTDVANLRVVIGGNDAPGFGAEAIVTELDEQGGIKFIEMVNWGIGYDTNTPPDVKIVDIGERFNGQYTTINAQDLASVAGSVYNRGTVLLIQGSSTVDNNTTVREKFYRVAAANITIAASTYTASSNATLLSNSNISISGNVASIKANTWVTLLFSASNQYANAANNFNFYVSNVNVTNTFTGTGTFTVSDTFFANTTVVNALNSGTIQYTVVEPLNYRGLVEIADPRLGRASPMIHARIGVDPATVDAGDAGDGTTDTAARTKTQMLNNFKSLNGPLRVAKFIVTGIDSEGSITALRIIDRGLYKVFPSDLTMGIPLEYDYEPIGQNSFPEQALGLVDPLRNNILYGGNHPEYQQPPFVNNDGSNVNKDNKHPDWSDLDEYRRVLDANAFNGYRIVNGQRIEDPLAFNEGGIGYRYELFTGTPGAYDPLTFVYIGGQFISKQQIINIDPADPDFGNYYEPRQIAGGQGARLFLTAMEVPDCSEKGTAKEALGLPDTVSDVNGPEVVALQMNNALAAAGYKPKDISVEVTPVGVGIDTIDIKTPGYPGVRINGTPGFPEKLGIPVGDYFNGMLCIEATLSTPNLTGQQAVSQIEELYKNSAFGLLTPEQEASNYGPEGYNTVEPPQVLSLLCVNSIQTDPNSWFGNLNKGSALNPYDYKLKPPTEGLDTGLGLPGDLEFTNELYEYDIQNIFGENVALTGNRNRQATNVFIFESKRFFDENAVEAVDDNNTSNITLAAEPKAWIDSYINRDPANVTMSGFTNGGWAYLEYGVPKRWQTPLTNPNYVKNVILYNQEGGEKITDFEFWDPFKGIIPGFVRNEIHFVSINDPVNYNNARTNFGQNNVGKVWWDTSTLRYMWYEQGSDLERWKNWGRTFPGSTITVCEWVESKALPQNWTGDGTPRWLDRYITERRYDPVNEKYENFYYYWVQNRSKLDPRLVEQLGRKHDVETLAKFIANPSGYGLNLVSFVSENSFVLNNIGQVLPEDSGVIQINLSRNLNADGIKHTAWKLMREGDNNSIVPEHLSEKLIDSLAGEDAVGSFVPDRRLSNVERYGISFRPRQTMFDNMWEARRVMVYVLNEILADIKLKSVYPNWDSNLTYDNVFERANWYEVRYVDQATNTKVRYDSSYKPVYNVSSVSELESNLDVPDGTVLQVKGSTGDRAQLWMFDYDAQAYKLIAIENETIRIKDSVFDSGAFPTTNPTDLRNLLIALKDNVFRNNQYWNVLFFALMKHAYMEQGELSWAFKTSYVYVEKDEEDLIEFVGFKPENFNKVIEYMNEAKPFTAKIREYKDGKRAPTEVIGVGMISDFDKPPYPDPLTGNVRILDDFLLSDANILANDDRYINYNSILDKNAAPFRRSTTTIVFDRTNWEMTQTGFNANTTTINRSIARNIANLTLQSNAEVSANVSTRAVDRIFKFDSEVQAMFVEEVNAHYGNTTAGVDANVITNANILTNIIDAGNLSLTLALVKDKVGGNFRGDVLDANIFTKGVLGLDSTTDYLDVFAWDTAAWDSFEWDEKIDVFNYQGIFSESVQGNITFRRNNTTYEGFDGITFKRVLYGEERPEEMVMLSPLESMIMRVTTNIYPFGNSVTISNVTTSLVSFDGAGFPYDAASLANYDYSGNITLSSNGIVSVGSSNVFFVNATMSNATVTFPADRDSTFPALVQLFANGNLIIPEGTSTNTLYVPSANANTFFYVSSVTANAITGAGTFTIEDDYFTSANVAALANANVQYRIGVYTSIDLFDEAVTNATIVPSETASANASNVQYQIHQNLFGQTEYLRILENNKTTLAANVFSYSTEITVVDASGFANPRPQVPGVLWMGSEKVLYERKTGNTFGGLTRGVAGTAVQNWLIADVTGAPITVEVFPGDSEETFNDLNPESNVWLDTGASSLADLGNAEVSNVTSIMRFLHDL